MARTPDPTVFTCPTCGEQTPLKDGWTVKAVTFCFKCAMQAQERHVEGLFAEGWEKEGRKERKTLEYWLRSHAE